MLGLRPLAPDPAMRQQIKDKHTQGKTGFLIMIDDPTFTFRFKPPFDVSNAANKATDDCLNEAVNLEAAQK